MPSGQSAAHYLAFAKQSAFGTAISTASLFRFFAMRAGGLKLNRPSKGSDQLRGLEPRWMRAQNQLVEGSLPMDCYYEGMGLVLNSFLTRVSTEVASYTVTTGANDKINFKEASGGSQFTATVAAGTYTSTTLCAAIKTALEVPGADTFTVTYAASTGLFTIASNGTYLQLMFATGTNQAISIASLIGFAATDQTDSSGGISITGGSAAWAAYDHVFTVGDSGAFVSAQGQQYGLTVLEHKDLETFQARAFFANALGMSWAENDVHAPLITLGGIAADLQPIASVTPTAGSLNDTPGSPDGNFGLTVGINGNTYADQYIKQLVSNLTMPTALRHAIGSTKAVKAVRTGKAAGTLQFGWDYEDDNDLKDDLIATWNDKSAYAGITIAQPGETIRGAIKQGWTMALPACRPLGETPQAAQGTIEQPYSFAIQRDTDNDASMMTLTLRNAEYVA